MNKVFFIFILLLNFSVSLSSVDTSRFFGIFNYSLSFGVGVSNNIDTISQSFDKIGVSLSTKFLIESPTNLSIGLEFSYLNLAHYKNDNYQTAYGTTSVDNTLYGYPLIFITQYKYKNLVVFGGYGAVRVTSIINSFNSSSTSSQWDSIIHGGLGLSFNIIEDLKLVTEAKYYVVPALFKNIVSTQLLLKYYL